MLKTCTVRIGKRIDFTVREACNCLLLPYFMEVVTAPVCRCRSWTLGGQPVPSTGRFGMNLVSCGHTAVGGLSCLVKAFALRVMTYKCSWCDSFVL